MEKVRSTGGVLAILAVILTIVFIVLGKLPLVTGAMLVLLGLAMLL